MSSSVHHQLNFWTGARGKFAEALAAVNEGGIRTDEKTWKPGLTDASLIITFNEVCHQHGTGVLLDRLFSAAKNIIHLRSTSFYPTNYLGEIAMELGHVGRTDREVFASLVPHLQRHDIRRILCVPFGECDLRSALAARNITGAPLCLYLMDDQNIYAPNIGDGLMARTLKAADLVLAISPEMRDAYENKFGVKTWLLPPTVTRPSPEVAPSGEAGGTSSRGVLVGNIWDVPRMEKLLGSLRGSGLEVDWFSNGAVDFPDHSREMMRSCGLHPQGYLPEAVLTRRLKDYAYSVLLAGDPGEDGASAWLSALSLPSRLPYVVAVGGLPVFALGSADTPVGHFVERFGVGIVSRASGEALRAKVAEMHEPETRKRYRENARRIAPLFDGKDIAAWIWQSLDMGQPADDRFENAFTRRADNFTAWIDAPVPDSLFWQFQDCYRAVARLKGAGFRPDFVLDLGCSTGVWSHSIHSLFPAARFLLVDPILNRYRAKNPWYFENHPEFECFETAVGDQAGTATLNISGDDYGTSLFRPEDGRSYEKTAGIPVTTVDLLLEQAKASGQGFLKIDVQGAEWLVLRGAQQSLKRMDFILMELSLENFAPEALNFARMLELMRDSGFDYHDDAGGWRSPRDGRLIQKDVLFRRRDYRLPEGKGY